MGDPVISDLNNHLENQLKAQKHYEALDLEAKLERALAEDPGFLLYVLGEEMVEHRARLTAMYKQCDALGIGQMVLRLLDEGITARV